MNGILIIDKPAGLTSHDVVNRLRRILQERSVGHLGTLDPSATGVLPMVVGNLTRLAQFYIKVEKSYEGVIRFGFATDTYDAEGEAADPPQAIALSLVQVRELASEFTGPIEQMPPPFSAKKIQGVPAYKLARKNKDVPLKPVQVEVKKFEILNVDRDRAAFRVHVASGTYVRSLAHDMGAKLGCGAHLESLRRTVVGEFTLTDAHTLEEVDAVSKRGEVENIFIHPRKLLPQLPSVTVSDEVAAQIRSGRTVNLPEFSSSRQVKVFLGQQDLISIATRVAGTLFHPKIVMPPTPSLHTSRSS
jgi:tRNA pseudouridine55 synthase